MHRIFMRSGCSNAKPAGTNWEEFAGTLRHIAVGEGPVLWGVDYVHQVWFKQIGDLIKDREDGQEKYWDHIDTETDVMKEVDRHPKKYLGFFNLDVGRNGHLWALSGRPGTSKVWWRSGITESNK